MKKRILSLLLILCMAVTLLPTAAFAAGPGDGEATSPRTSVEKDNGPVHVKKSVSTDGDETKLTLEAYLTNEVIQTVSAKPLDIVLVLDQSGSMAYDFNGDSTNKDTERRQYAMKQAVNSFIEKATSADGTHNMAVVTFGTDAAVLNNGWTQVNADGAKALTTAINQLPQEPEGATNVGAGMQEAQKLVNSQTSTDRQKVVIVFTDGIPTTTDVFNTDVANSAITAAKSMKNAGATIYTVGIFNGADPREMYGASGFDTNSDGTVKSKWAEENWGLFPSTDFPKADRPAGNRFLNLVSSNYPKADSIGLERKTSGAGILHYGISYTVTKNFDRAAEGSYYLKADSSSGLNAIFQKIIEEISTLDIVADKKTILSDTLSEYFTLNVPDGVTDAKTVITAEKWDCTGKDENGNYTWKKADTQPTTMIEVTGKTINVTGFDYTENAVTATTKEGVTIYSGAKLVITIPIKPNAACTAWQAGERAYPTNSTTANSKAGLSNYADKDGKAVDPTLLDQSPEANVTAYSVTYTDGATGETVFEDQVSTVLPGTATPAFSGTPTRDGYDFKGWSPAVTDTVTGDVTYTAQWEKQTPAETFTVTYTDGVDGEEIFKDQTYTVESGKATPAFSGTPTRDGYQFIGWEPTVAETVTANATYTAQWKQLTPSETKYTVKYDWGTDAPGNQTLPADQNEYSSVEAARAAKDTGFSSASTSDAPRDGKAGTWKFSGWDEGKLEGTVLVFTGHWTFEAKETAPTWDWKVSKSKTATKLDTNTWTSDVTLSLPSAQEELSSDIVFVLDTSDCVGKVMDQVQGLVSDLKEAQEKNNAEIKVGVVAFKGSALPMFDGKLVSVKDAEATLTKMAEEVSKAGATSDKEAVVLKYLNADADFIYKGSNLHSGLLGAQALLKEDTSVADSRKYVVTVTDGMTYYWNDSENNVYGIYSGSNANGAAYPSLLFYAWCEAHNISMNNPNLYQLPEGFEGWDSYLQNAKALEAQDNGKYAINIRETKNTLAVDFGSVRFSTVDTLTDKKIPYIPETDKATHAHGMDYSVTACLDTYKEMVDAGYQCYTLNPDYGTDTFPGLFTSKLNEMANKTVVNFDSIQNGILYAVGAGSTVEDKMGNEFDFVPGSLKLTVGGKALAAKPDGNVTYFGDAADALGESNYRFKVSYDPTADAFEWTINENVSNFAPVQLTYTVKLVNPKTAAGTYTEPTNEYAKLFPKDSAGQPGEPQDFDTPYVSYTVKESGGGGSSTTYYYFAIEKIDAQDSHTLGGAKFGLYLDGKQIATATSNRSGIAMFRVYESDYRKINAKSDLYYQELTAPEGYVVDSNKVSIEKSDLTTSWSKAEKDAETVRNYRGSTPDLLNGDDHFAYVIGYQDGCVHPNALITRAETATIFFRLLKDEVRDGNLRTSNTFADVADHYWANTAISTMAGLGIVQGRSSTAFDPNASITRAEFAAICARFDTGKSSGTQTFSDIKGHWAQSYIERAAELGWIKGFEDGTFRPDDRITRAQAMTMINRVLNRIPEDASDLLPDMNVWPDCNPGDWFYLAVQEATNSHNYKHKAGNYETWTSMKQDPDWTRYEN